ncbi:MAG: hypothetical protein L6437_04375 [Kiritimatiellae bacterium]|nr:hypothetical protein [Kiritimatiellia bacterium]
MSIIAMEPQPTAMSHIESELASDPRSSFSADESRNPFRVLSSITDIAKSYAQFPKYRTSPYLYRYAVSSIPSMGCFILNASMGTMLLNQPSWHGFIATECEERLSEIVKKSVVCRLSSFSEDVQQFLEGRNLVPHFFSFFNLASSAFNVQRCATSLQVHPKEQGMEWIELEVSVEGETLFVLKQYNKFLESTSANIPPDALQWFRLSLNIL